MSLFLALPTTPHSSTNHSPDLPTRTNRSSPFSFFSLLCLLPPLLHSYHTHLSSSPIHPNNLSLYHSIHLSCSYSADSLESVYSFNSHDSRHGSSQGCRRLRCSCAYRTSIILFSDICNEACCDIFPLHTDTDRSTRCCQVPASRSRKRLKSVVVHSGMPTPVTPPSNRKHSHSPYSQGRLRDHAHLLYCLLRNGLSCPRRTSFPPLTCLLATLDPKWGPDPETLSIADAIPSKNACSIS